MKTPTWKQHTFAKLPRVLCFHLKRFDFLKKKKITDPVGFPVSVNMGTFLPGWTEVIQGDTHSLSNWSMMLERQNDTDVSATAPLVMYDLYATIDHTGSLNQGHYVSNVKVNGKWYNCNDSFVSHMDEAAILKSENVYMLFYSRRQ
jgi:ubiquitin carboxyl-terminal hydrolase 22/27/51